MAVLFELDGLECLLFFKACLDDRDHWCSLLFSSPGCLAIHGTGDFLTLIFGLVAGVLVSGNPRVAVLQGLVLRGEVDPLTSPGGVVAVALGESAGTGRQVRLDDSLGGHPVGQGIFAVLDDGFAGVVSVVGLTGLTGSDRSVVNKVQKVLAVAGNDSDLLAVLTESIELVLEGGLELLTGDVGQLSLGDEGLGLSTDQFLLENDDARRVGVLVLELGDLVGDFLLACDRLVRSVLNSGKGTYGRG